jgi:ATP-dependent DNA helicase RecQ
MPSADEQDSAMTDADARTELRARLHEVLKAVWGYDAFRPLQLDIIESTLSRRDTVAILPTGAGKSLCYQLPALVREGLTVVVSPLIALMKDQVDQLEAAGVAATYLNSTLDAAEFRERLGALDRGEHRLLFVAPERAVVGEFLPRLARWNTTLLAVDEAHCISEWGHDFRPEYRRLAEVRAALGGVTTLALTATATPRVREDIVAQLGLRDPAVFLGSFNRPNLAYRVVAKERAAAQVAAFVEARRGEAGIVYCQSRRGAESMAESLATKGVRALPYHAGLESATRAANQDAFLRDEVDVICATVAFGMGINKPNVRFVVHADLSKNVESYYQETGRAGRDGLPSECLLLYSRGDVAKYIGFLDEIDDLDARRVARAQLDRMTAYAETASCRRADLLAYFGERWPESGDDGRPRCDGCDNCLEPRATVDATLESQKFLSCVLRIRQRSGFGVGLAHVAEVLVGANTEKIRRWGHDELTTYGIGKDRPRAEWLSLGRQLVQAGFLDIASGTMPVVEVSERGLEALRARTPIELVTPVAPPKPDRAKARPAGAIACDEALFERLRALRKSIADARGVPPYVVFSDATLRAMAAAMPSTRESFLAVQGIGEKKYADFGEAFAAEIEAWRAGGGEATAG